MKKTTKKEQTEQVENNVTISADLAQAIFNYLIEKPYKEVGGLVGELSNQVNR